MEISVQEIIDYCNCPLLYRYKYVNKYKHEQTILEKYEHEIKTIIFYLCSFPYNQQKIPTLKKTLRQWHYKWDKRSTLKEFVESVSNLSSSDAEARRKNLYRQGIVAIETFYDNYVDNFGAPLLFSKDYHIEIGQHSLKGTIDLVRETEENKTKSLEMFHFKYKTNHSLLRQDITITANSLAFRMLMGVSEQRIIEYDILTGSNTLTKRNESDYKSFISTLNNVEKAIQNKIYYPVFNHKCLQCSFKNKCRGG